jgi:NAD(P)-dependent dehydrogenase (short-subunit alcohol dehydrogenase family)
LEILIIGGTRNLGHLLTLELLQAGHRVTVFNRGQTPDELPADVQRLRGDRSDPARLAPALAGRSFDGVVDTTLYNGADAQTITALLDGRVGQYLFLSTGQVCQRLWKKGHCRCSKNPHSWVMTPATSRVFSAARPSAFPAADRNPP